jgi:hypothetical protein
MCRNAVIFKIPPKNKPAASTGGRLFMNFETHRGHFFLPTARFAQEHFISMAR